MPTIGVSVAIPEPWGSDIQQYRTSLGDPTATQIPTHITLVPPTDVADLDAVEAHLRATTASLQPFAVKLSGTGTFRPISPVVFVQLVSGIECCTAFAGALRTGPLDVQLDFPYHPHVTIGHHLPDDVLDQAMSDLGDFGCEFTVNSFYLYVHDETHGWRPVTEFTVPPGVPTAGE